MKTLRPLPPEIRPLPLRYAPFSRCFPCPCRAIRAVLRHFTHLYRAPSSPDVPVCDTYPPCPPFCQKARRRRKTLRRANGSAAPYVIKETHHASLYCSRGHVKKYSINFCAFQSRAFGKAHPRRSSRLRSRIAPKGQCSRAHSAPPLPKNLAVHSHAAIFGNPVAENFRLMGKGECGAHKYRSQKQKPRFLLLHIALCEKRSGKG